MKGLIIFSHQMEDVEALATRALLKRAGLQIDTVTFEETLEIQTAFGLTVHAEHFAKDIVMEDYGFLVIPGGPYVAERIEAGDDTLEKLSVSFAKEKKLVAAICAAPRFLGRAKLLDRKGYTAFPGSEIDIPKGYYHPDMKTYKDGLIITSRGAGTVYTFAFEIVRTLKGESVAKKLFAAIQH